MTRTPRASHWTEVLFPDEIVDLSPGKTGLIVPIGTSDDRPPETPGLIRYNTTIGALEVALPTGYQPLGGPDGVGGGPDGNDGGGSGGAVNTVFGRFGNVNAMSGDYTAEQVVNVPMGNLSSTNVQNALYELQTEIDGVVAGLADRIIDDDGDTSVTTQEVLGSNIILARVGDTTGEVTDATRPILALGRFGVEIETQETNTGGSGSILLRTGNNNGDATTGDIDIETGDSGNAKTGDINIRTGGILRGQDGPNTAGSIALQTSDTDISGPISIAVGDSFAGLASGILVRAGNGSTGDGGNIDLVAGVNFTGAGQPGTVNIRGGGSSNAAGVIRLYNGQNTSSVSLEPAIFNEPGVRFVLPGFSGRDGQVLTIVGPDGGATRWADPGPRMNLNTGSLSSGSAGTVNIPTSLDFTYRLQDVIVKLERPGGVWTTPISRYVNSDQPPDEWYYDFNPQSGRIDFFRQGEFASNIQYRITGLYQYDLAPIGPEG